MRWGGWCRVAGVMAQLLTSLSHTARIRAKTRRTSSRGTRHATNEFTLAWNPVARGGTAIIDFYFRFNKTAPRMAGATPYCTMRAGTPTLLRLSPDPAASPLLQKGRPA
jgi:hypothetical protein